MDIQRKLRSNRTCNFCTPEKEATFCTVLMGEVRKKPHLYLLLRQKEHASVARLVKSWDSLPSKAVLSCASDSQKSQTTTTQNQFTCLRVENRLWCFPAPFPASLCLGMYTQTCVHVCTHKLLLICRTVKGNPLSFHTKNFRCINLLRRRFNMV